MDGFLALERETKERLCQEVSARRGSSARAIEKDFWVCWTLRELFAVPEFGDALTFKGGTSLSKGWKLIDRFSEDIDVVVDRRILGFDQEHLTKNQLRRLRRTCQEWIAGELIPTLKKEIEERLEAEVGWYLELAGQEDEADRETIHFGFPSLDLPGGSYIRPIVRIELGARSEAEPTETPRIASYLFEEFPRLVGESALEIRCVAPRRTFLEKMMLLHEERFRPPEKARPERLSRHYYDLWSMLRHGVGQEVIKDPDLIARVARHRQRFWGQSWVDYSTLQRGSWRFVPSAESLELWSRDYEAMREMFFGEVPSFEQVMDAIEEFEVSINQ